jgi:hypothetical protein
MAGVALMVCPKAPQPSLGLAEIRPHFGPPESSRMDSVEGEAFGGNV